MTEPAPEKPFVERLPDQNKPKRIRFPQIDFVTLVLAILAAVILLFITAELWLPHVNG